MTCPRGLLRSPPCKLHCVLLAGCGYEREESTASAARTTQRRKMLLTRLLARARVGLQDNDHIVEAGDVAFRHACQPGLEGIVSKRLGSRYTSGRTRGWIKMKNTAAPAVKREAEEDWGR